MNKHIIFRSFFWLIPRALVLTVCFYFIPWIEWSPLPDLSTLLSYAYHLILTYLFARLAFGRHIPSWLDASIVSLIFIIFGTGIEIAIKVWRTGAALKFVSMNYNWHSLGIVLVYCLAVFLAAWRVRHKQQKEISALRPIEVRSSEEVLPSSDQRPQAQA